MNTYRTVPKLLLLFYLVTVTAACGPLGKTKNETEAVQAIAAFYEGICEPSKIFSASTEAGKKK